MIEYNVSREQIQNALDILESIGDDLTLANREKAMKMFHDIYYNAKAIFEELYEITGEMIQEEKGLPRDQGRKFLNFKE